MIEPKPAMRPPPGEDSDNDFHEVWWNDLSTDGCKGKRQVQLHEVWQWMGDAPEQCWHRCGEATGITVEDAYAEGWRYVCPVRLHDQVMRMAGEPPHIEH